jgi:hypothetical protein
MYFKSKIAEPEAKGAIFVTDVILGTLPFKRAEKLKAKNAGRRQQEKHATRRRQAE